MMSLLVGSACTILLGAGAFYLLDYMKKAPMGTTINTIKAVSYTHLDVYKRQLQYEPIARNHPGLVHILHVGRHDQDSPFYYLSLIHI